MVDIINYNDFNGHKVIEIDTEEFGLQHVSRVSKSNNVELQKLNYPNIIVDLNKITYIDTSGLGFIANIKRQLSKHGSDVVIVCKNDYILQLITLTKLDSLIKLVGDLDEAAKYLNEKKISTPKETRLN